MRKPMLYLLLVASVITVTTPRSSRAQGVEPPVYLRDRGTGVALSQFGSYIRRGELVVYPFFEWYSDKNLEYKPSELGYAGDIDYRGRYRASEGLLFLGYGVTEDLALEFEAAVISAHLRKAPNDPSAMPSEVKASGLGDVEGQVRWRFRRETERRTELFTYFELVFPFQKDKLIGTSAFEYKLGIGRTRGYSWGTMTWRAAVEYSGEEKKFEAGEYAIEYLRQFSPAWRMVAIIEGNQLDEVAFIPEIQWRFHPRARFKANVGIGLTPNATDIAPEVGVMFTF